MSSSLWKLVLMVASNLPVFPCTLVILLTIYIIDTPLKGLFSDKNYKHINLLCYYYI
jgi:hypothetical protein